MFSKLSSTTESLKHSLSKSDRERAENDDAKRLAGSELKSVVANPIIIVKPPSTIKKK